MHWTTTKGTVLQFVLRLSGTGGMLYSTSIKMSLHHKILISSVNNSFTFCNTKAPVENINHL